MGSGNHGRKQMKCFYPIVLLALSPLAACRNDTTAPGSPDWTLTGRVIDARGDPVPGAFVNIGYTVLTDGDTVWTPPAAAPAPPFSPTVLDSFQITIYDHRGRKIWNMSSSADINQAFWPGTDLDGTPVPDGPYRYVLTAYPDGISRTLEHWLAIARDIAGRTKVADTVADAHGRFSIPASYLPIWETYSNPPSTIAFGTGIALYAFRGDGSVEHGRMSLDLSRSPGFEAVLQIPDPSP
jgi:hypothetical protein